MFEKLICRAKGHSLDKATEFYKIHSHWLDVRQEPVSVGYTKDTYRKCNRCKQNILINTENVGDKNAQ